MKNILEDFYFKTPFINISYLLLVVVASGCVQMRTNMIPEDAEGLRWLKAIEESNGAVFVSKDGRRDTMLTSKIDFPQDRFSFTISDEHDPFETIGSNARCGILIKHEGDSIPGEFRIYTKPDKRGIYHTSNIGTRHSISEPDSLRGVLRTVYLDGLLYENCMVVDSLNSSDLWNTDDAVREYAFNSKLGLLYYTMPDGRVYVREPGKPISPAEPRFDALPHEIMFHMIESTIRLGLSYIGSIFSH